METLKVVSMGDAVQGVHLKGDKANPEPIHFRVCLPFGDVDIARTTDGQYWIHLRVNKADDSDCIAGGKPIGAISGARLDIAGKSVNDNDCGDFDNPDLYHLALKIGER